jgi:hypothetical protein
MILAAQRWPNNAALIADAAQLGYLKRHWRILDPTYGRGCWWKAWCPVDLVTHDIRQDEVDFRDLPHDNNEFHAIAFDPPYMAPGGRTTTTIGDFNDRFGLHTTGRKPADQQAIINDGLIELQRVLCNGGYLLVKCMDYINGGAYWSGTHHTLTKCIELGLVQVDRLEHIRKLGPQSQTTQEHARRNLSTLLVFKKPNNGRSQLPRVKPKR